MALSDMPTSLARMFSPTDSSAAALLVRGTGAACWMLPPKKGSCKECNQHLNIAIQRGILYTTVHVTLDLLLGIQQERPDCPRSVPFQ